MKKFLVLAALAVSLCGLAGDAFAVGSRMKVTGLTWDTWTPQGPVTGSDTTFINGATQTQDTTGVFDATKVDWNAMARLDPNIGANIGFKVYVQGTNISTDSITVTIEGSVDKNSWYAAKVATAVGRPTTHGTNFNVLSFPYVPTNLTGDAVASYWPYFRFIIKADGNTAARLTAERCKVVWYVADDKIASAPRMVWRQLTWGTWAAGAFVSSRDTVSLNTNVVDTTGSISWANANLGPGVPVAVGATASDSNMVVSCLLIQSTSDPSTLDSVYVAIQGSADGYTWTTNTPVVALTLNAGYSSMASQTINQNLNGASIAGFIGNVGVVTGNPFGQLYPMSAFGTPYTRYVVKSAASGKVLGGAKVWVGQWVAPGSEIAD